VRPVTATLAIAVKVKRLLSHQEWEEITLFWGDLSTTFVIVAGRGGSEGAIHLPLLQQKVAASPSSNRARHFEHILFPWGTFHFVRFIFIPKSNHQLDCSGLSAVSSMKATQASRTKRNGQLQFDWNFRRINVSQSTHKAVSVAEHILLKQAFQDLILILILSHFI
jgi:hypothetical protein